MRIVTVGARHEALVHSMLRWHLELRAHARMTSIAEFPLLFRKQEFRSGRAMDRMAARARDIIQGMLRALDIGAREVFGVAGETSFEHALGFHQRKRAGNSGLSAACRDVLFGRPMQPSQPARSGGVFPVARLLK